MAVLALVLVFSLGESRTAMSADPIIIKYADGSKPGTSRSRAAEHTMLEIEKRTGGRVKHEFYWAQSLMKAKDTLMGVKSGGCDVGYAFAISYHKSRTPIWQFTQLPFVVGNDQYAASMAANELYDTNPILKKEFDDLGMHLLTLSAITPTLIVSKSPLREPEDFQGMRIRTTGPIAKFIAAMGGKPNPMPYHEISEAFARGLLDGAQSYIYTFHAWKHYEYCKYLLLTGLGHIVNEYWINPNTLKKMPPDVRKIYLDTWRDFHIELNVKYHDEDKKKQINDFKEAGVNMYTLTPEQLVKWKKVAEPVNEEYFKAMEEKGIDARKIVADYQRLYKKYELK